MNQLFLELVGPAFIFHEFLLFEKVLTCSVFH